MQVRILPEVQNINNMNITDKITITNEDNMKLMARYPDNYFDLAIVDPPYKIASQQKRGVGSRIDSSGKMNQWNNETPSPQYFEELFRVSKIRLYGEQIIMKVYQEQNILLYGIKNRQ